MKPSVLLTNDDGIDSPGLRLLVKELASRDVDVYVVAPRQQVSGAGKSNSFVVRVESVKLDEAAGAWAIEGKPADAVAIGIKKLLPRRPNLVVSGINIGPNAGLVDFFTSGTIGAAIEASILGVRSIAASYASLRGLNDDDLRHLAEDARVTAELAIRLLRAGDRFDGIDILNVNFPRGVPKGIALATISVEIANVEVYDDDADPSVLHVLGWRTDNISEAYAGGEEGSDVDAIKRGYIAITPICLRCMMRSAVTPGGLRMVKELLDGLTL